MKRANYIEFENEIKNWVNLLSTHYTDTSLHFYLFYKFSKK